MYAQSQVSQQPRGSESSSRIQRQARGAEGGELSPRVQSLLQRQLAANQSPRVTELSRRSVSLSGRGGTAQAKRAAPSGTPGGDVVQRVITDRDELIELHNSVAEITGQLGLPTTYADFAIKLLARTHDSTDSAKGGIDDAISTAVSILRRTPIEPGSLTKAQFNPSALKFFFGGGRAEANRKHTRSVAVPMSNGSFMLQGMETGEFDPPSAEDWYAYVTMADGALRVWPAKMKGAKRDTFHAGLASFASHVGYAGEVRFDDSGNVIEWNNGSGNYMPKSATADLAGLPMDERFKSHKGSE